MRYGFVGCGNMGGAIARGLAGSTKEILVSDRSGITYHLPLYESIVYQRHHA